MKKTSLVIILFIVIILLFFNKKNTSDKHSFHVVTSFTILADISQEIAGPHAQVHSITKIGAEIHDYQPTPKDLSLAQKADLIIYNGLNLERWFKRFLQDLNDTPVVIASQGITPLSIYQGPYQGKPNPHAWMSLSNGLIYIENIKNALIAHDPKNKDHYEKNAQIYAAKLKAKQKALHDRLSNIPQEKRYLISSEGAFSYLAKDLNMKERYIWPINAEQQGTPQQIKVLVDEIKAKNLPVIFSESTISPKAAQEIAKESGCHYGGILYVDSLSKADGPVPSYLDLLDQSISTIAKGFEKALQP